MFDTNCIFPVSCMQHAPREISCIQPVLGDRKAIYTRCCFARVHLLTKDRPWQPQSSHPVTQFCYGSDMPCKVSRLFKLIRTKWNRYGLSGHVLVKSVYNCSEIASPWHCFTVARDGDECTSTESDRPSIHYELSFSETRMWLLLDY